MPPASVEVVPPAPQSAEEPIETVLPDGSVMLDLKGLGQQYYILQLDADGKRVVRCAQDPHGALQGPPSPSKPEDR